MLLICVASAQDEMQDEMRNPPGGGALLISLIDPMIDQKNAGIGSFFGVENRKIPAFRVLFLRSVS